MRPTCPHFKCRRVLTEILVDGSNIHQLLEDMLFSVQVEAGGRVHSPDLEPRTMVEAMLWEQFSPDEQVQWYRAVEQHVVYLGTDLLCPHCGGEFDWDPPADTVEDDTTPLKGEKVDGMPSWQEEVEDSYPHAGPI